MRKFYLIFSLMLVIFFATTLMAVGGTKSNDKAKKGKEDPLLALYKNKSRFEMLSGAAQTALQRRFGKKKVAGHPEPAPPATKERDRILAPAATLTNVLVNDPTLDTTLLNTQSETTIVLAGTNNVVVAYNDSGSFTSGDHFTGYSRSTDGGVTFTDLGFKPASTEGDAGDPVLARNDTTGRVYLSTLGFNTGEVLQVFRSDDNGLTFMAPVSIGFTGMGDFQDKEWITVDNFVGSGQGNAYVAWRSFGDGIYFTRSTDHGSTWSAPLKVQDQGSFNVQGAFVTVSPDHSVHVFWLDQSGGGGTTNRIRVKKSTDGGLTFSAFVNVATLTTTLTNGGLNLNGGFRTNAFPHAAVNPVSGNMYVTWGDDVFGADRSDVFMSMSTNGGANWSAPTNISDLFDTSTNDDWSPTLAVTPDGTKVGFFWYDRELDPKNSYIDWFNTIAAAAPGSLTFGPQSRITDQSFPTAQGDDPAVITNYMGDYDQAVADNSSFYTVWGDNRLPSSSFPNQPDVRFAKVPVNGKGTILAFNQLSISDFSGDNNGRVDMNDCIDVTVRLKNLGTADATGVSAVLTTGTPGVTITTDTSAYPNIAPGASAVNTTPFRFTTSPSFVCGINIEFILTVTTGDGTFIVTFRVQTGGDGSPSQFDNNTPTPIVDNTTTNIPINVSGFTGNIGKITVLLQLNHTWDGDLDIFLIAPDGTTVLLSSDNGDDLDNYGTNCSNRTIFDDAAGSPINLASPPFTGTFQPEGSLSDFNGLTGSGVNGTWILRIRDDVQFDSGTLNCVALIISPATCTDAGGCTIGGCNVYQTGFDGPFDWEPIKPACTNVSSNLECDPVSRKAWANVPTATPTCDTCDVTTSLLNTSNDFDSRMWLYTNQIDKKNRIEIKFLMLRDKVVLIDKFAGTRRGKAKADVVLDPNVFYLLQTTYDGTNYIVSINSTPVIIYPITGLQAGDQGIAGKGANTIVRASDFCVNDP